MKLIEHQSLIQKDELEQNNNELAEEFSMNEIDTFSTIYNIRNHRENKTYN